MGLQGDGEIGILSKKRYENIYEFYQVDEDVVKKNSKYNNIGRYDYGLQRVETIVQEIFEGKNSYNYESGKRAERWVREKHKKQLLEMIAEDNDILSSTTTFLVGKMNEFIKEDERNKKRRGSKRKNSTPDRTREEIKRLRLEEDKKRGYDPVREEKRYPYTQEDSRTLCRIIINIGKCPPRRLPWDNITKIFNNESKSNNQPTRTLEGLKTHFHQVLRRTKEIKKLTFKKAARKIIEEFDQQIRYCNMNSLTATSSHPPPLQNTNNNNNNNNNNNYNYNYNNNNNNNNYNNNNNNSFVPGRKFKWDDRLTLKLCECVYDKMTWAEIAKLHTFKSSIPSCSPTNLQTKLHSRIRSLRNILKLPASATAVEVAAEFLS